MRNITFAVTGTPALLVLSGGGTSGTAQPSGVPLLFLQAKLQLTPGFLNQPSGRNRRDPQSPVSTFQFPFSTFHIPRYSPYGTQTFFTCTACRSHHFPSLCAASNQSIARPSFVNTCFKFPIESNFAITLCASSPKLQSASTSACSASTRNNSVGRPLTKLITPPGRSLVSNT